MEGEQKEHKEHNKETEFIPIAISKHKEQLTDQAVLMLGDLPLRPFELNKWLDPDHAKALRKSNSNSSANIAMSSSSEEDDDDEEVALATRMAFVLHVFEIMICKEDCHNKLNILEIYQRLVENYNTTRTVPNLVRECCRKCEAHPRDVFNAMEEALRTSAFGMYFVQQHKMNRDKSPHH